MKKSLTSCVLLAAAGAIELSKQHADRVVDMDAACPNIAWRENGDPTFKSTGGLVGGVFGGTIYVDNEPMHAAHEASGQWLFSEVGAGAKPIVFVGTAQDIVQCLSAPQYNNGVHGIQNRMSDELWVDFYVYKPAPGDFTTIIDGGAAIKAAVGQLTNFIPVQGVAATQSLNAAGIVEQIKNAVDAKRSSSSPKKVQGTNTKLYVRISPTQKKVLKAEKAYIPGGKIGRGVCQSDTGYWGCERPGSEVFPTTDLVGELQAIFELAGYL